MLTTILPIINLDCLDTIEEAVFGVGIIYSKPLVGSTSCVTEAVDIAVDAF